MQHLPHQDSISQNFSNRCPELMSQLRRRPERRIRTFCKLCLGNLCRPTHSYSQLYRTEVPVPRMSAELVVYPTVSSAARRRFISLQVRTNGRRSNIDGCESTPQMLILPEIRIGRRYEVIPQYKYFEINMLRRCVDLILAIAILFARFSNWFIWGGNSHGYWEQANTSGRCRH